MFPIPGYLNSCKKVVNNILISKLIIEKFRYYFSYSILVFIKTDQHKYTNNLVNSPCAVLITATMAIETATIRNIFTANYNYKVIPL